GGDARAQFVVGQIYSFGLGVAENDAEAASWYGKSAGQGYAPAQTLLADFYQGGRGVAQDDAQAASWRRKAAEQGYAPAQTDLAWMYNQGRGVVKNYEESASWLLKAARQDYASAQFGLGQMYSRGQGVAQNDAEAASWYRKAAELGFADAQGSFGWAYASGRGVPQNDAEAASWYRKAADQGLADAQFGLGEMCEKGQALAQDDAAAASWYRKAAEQGLAQAQAHLGGMYAQGRGVAQNDVEAMAWYRKAAEQGLAMAQVILGEGYQGGRGVARNDVEAMAWYRKAAEQGLAAAQYHLGGMYSQGQGPARNDIEAMVWYRKAAEQGDSAAQVELGRMYEFGRGTAKNYDEAAAWYLKAAEQGQAEAKIRLGKLSMRPDKATARSPLAGGFQPTAAPEISPPPNPPDVDVSSGEEVDFRALDAASLAKFNAVFEQDENPVTSPPRKAQSWRQLARDVPKYAETAGGRAAQWEEFGRKLARARDEDWARLERCLVADVFAEKDKKRWSAEFLRDYWAWPGVPPAMASELAAHVEEGAMRDALAALEPEARAGIQWLRIPGGNFMMGSDEADFKDAKPRHRVTVKSFDMAKTLVTNKQYRECVAAGACSPAHASDGKCEIWNYAAYDYAYGTLPASFLDDDQPVVCVDWDQAKTFSRWAGGRLPSEAEWEYAARSGGKDWTYPWGNENATCERAMLRGCGDEAPAPVCSKPAGNTLQGLCDMAGNVWEWLQDSYHDSYVGAPTDGSAWEIGGPARDVRGAMFTTKPSSARSSFRYSIMPSFCGYEVGFRIARSVRAAEE
ncbi:MAG: SUMF1/EgtB/PvdO family nonheme iron enzyme, partial [Elusimicrobiota bacterium]